MITTRIQSGKIYFELEDGLVGYGPQIALAAQQKVSIKRTVEKKEAYSNDTEINQTIEQIVTKSTYEFSTEIGDISLVNLGLAFRGLVSSGTYAVGGTFAGRTILDDTVAAKVGDPIIHLGALYLATTAYAAGAFDVSKCSKSRSLQYNQVVAENSISSTGRITALTK